MALIDQLRLDGKILVVIGAASGHREGRCPGVRGDRGHGALPRPRGSAAEAVATHIRQTTGTAHAAALDLRDGEQVATTFDRIRDREQRLDVVICTPSVNVRKPLLRYTEEEFDRVVQLNLKGSFLALREAGRIMTAQRAGSIILYSSIRSRVVEPGQAVYAATKAGIVQLARTAAAEFGRPVYGSTRSPPVSWRRLSPRRSRPTPAWYRAYAAKTAVGRWARVDEMVGPPCFSPQTPRATSRAACSTPTADGPPWMDVFSRPECSANIDTSRIKTYT